MGLHTTPYGSFYVQRDLTTGEIIQVLPVQPKDTPDQLPSVGALGIDENFIESRRATFEASNVRASDSQGRLQRELASAGGRRLLETGRAVIAQRDDQHSASSTTSTSASSRHNQQDRDRDSPSGSSRRGSTLSYPSSSTNYTLSEDPHHQQSLHMHPVRPWPESLPHDTASVSLPPFREFREIDTARAPSHEDEARRHDERGCSSRYQRSSRGSRSSRRSNSTAFSISSMMTDSEGGSSTYSASEASTPTALSPIPDYYYCSGTGSSAGPGYSPAHPGCAGLPPVLSPEPMARMGSAGCSMAVDAPASHMAPHMASPMAYNTPRARASKTHASPASSYTSPSPAAPPARPPPPASPPAAKKQKTVWIIRTLEPRKMAANGSEYDDYEPQRVKTHVETHVAS